MFNVCEEQRGSLPAQKMPHFFLVAYVLVSFLPQRLYRLERQEAALRQPPVNIISSPMFRSNHQRNLFGSPERIVRKWTVRELQAARFR